MSVGFSELVMAGQRIEIGLKLGKLQMGNADNALDVACKNPFSGYPKKKEEANAVYRHRSGIRRRRHNPRFSSPARACSKGKHRIPAPTRHVPLVVNLSGPVPYSSEKAVPWHYGSDVYYHGVKQVFIPVPAKKEEVEKEDVNARDFSGVGRIIRSGRVFAPPNLQDVADALAKAKGK
ncbi:hypothetical protein KIW84_044838 [Lathyrus oleraceus]|uniref:Uncharacterized protein n=1 Tax=Pisum sativum TaxID=3888 RepID=A0A9D4XIR7_PEA|nr:hypothetical protein KIW84_044838 [Pisum sativum]